MSNDITITKIVNVFFQKLQNWERDFFAARQFDAAVLFTEGEIEYNFSHKTVIAKKGDILFLPGNLPYSGKKHTKEVAFFVIDFMCLTDNEFEKFAAPCVVETKEYQSVFLEFKKALEMWNIYTSKTTVNLKSFLYSLLGMIFYQEEITHFKTQTGEILSYIINNLSDSKLTVKKLCDRFYISESQLRRNIYKATGLSPNSYIVTLRINKAKSELFDSGKSINTIAYECGFTSQYYFSRCFSKITGMSPSKYRMLIS